MRSILENYLDEFYIVKDGNCYVLFPFKYTPFEQTRLDAYYLASHQCYLLCRKIANALNEAGFSASTRVNAPLKMLAVRAGMGVLGQNSLVYHREYGSRFVIGAIEVGQAEIAEAGEPKFHDACTNCDLCIKACPQGALMGFGRLDTTKCIRALMETGFVDDDLTAKRFGARVLGCDICQRACKLNDKATQKMPDICNQALDAVLTDNDNQQLSALIGKNMAKKGRIRRLVILEAGNTKRHDLLPHIKKLADDKDYEVNAKRAIALLE